MVGVTRRRLRGGNGKVVGLMKIHNQLWCASTKVFARSTDRRGIL